MPLINSTPPYYVSGYLFRGCAITFPYLTILYYYEKGLSRSLFFNFDFQVPPKVGIINICHNKYLWFNHIIAIFIVPIVWRHWPNKSWKKVEKLLKYIIDSSRILLIIWSIITQDFRGNSSKINNWIIYKKQWFHYNNVAGKCNDFYRKYIMIFQCSWTTIDIILFQFNYSWDIEEIITFWYNVEQYSIKG